MTLLGQRIDYLADMRRRGLIGIPEDESSYRTFWRWQKVVPVLALALVIAVTIRRPLDAFLAAVEDTAIVAPHHVEIGARLQGPVLLCSGCRVASGATIVGPAAIGADVTVEAGAPVERSVLWDFVRIGKRARMANSVLANRTVVRESAV